MIINFVIWSSLISLLAIIFLYPLRLHVRGSQISRFYAVALLFPALVSSLYVTKFANVDSSISQLFRIDLIGAYWGIAITQNNAPMNALLLVSIASMIFFLPDKKLIEHTLLLAICGLGLTIMVLTPDQLMKMLAYSLGNVAIVYVILSDEQERRVVHKVTNDFPVHLVSDFFAFTALVFLLLTQKTMFSLDQTLANSMGLLPRTCFVLAMSLRVIALLGMDTGSSFRLSALIKLSIFRKFFIATGSQILLFNFADVLFTGDSLQLLFTIIAVMTLIWALLRAAFEQKKTSIADGIINIATCSCFVLLTCQQKTVATIMLYTIIALYPLIALLVTTRRVTPSTTEKTIRLPSRYSGLFERVFLLIPMRVARFVSTFIIDFMVPIYSGFLLFRLPQIIIGILQTPLRLVHNGNLQRSLIFIAIVVVSLLWWEFP